MNLGTKDDEAAKRAIFRFLVNVAIIGVLFFAISKVSRLVPKQKPQPTMDNYSFSVGVWCAQRVLNPNGWRTNNHLQVLHDARHFSQTNGWLPFNNREGFQGDE